MLNNFVLEKVKKHKHLEVQLSEKLSWSTRTNDLLGKVSHMADTMKTTEVPNV